MPHRPVALRLAAAFSLATAAAGAQTVATEPVPPPSRAAQWHAERRRGPEVWASLRVTLGAAASDRPQEGAAFALGATAGARLFFDAGGGHAWVLHPDAGVDRTWGWGDRDRTLFSLGFSPGYAWGAFGVAWAPRGLYGWSDGGSALWGVRNGLRLLVVGGALDVEVAHQYVAGGPGGEHQALFTVGLDPGFVTHLILGFGRYRGR